MGKFGITGITLSVEFGDTSYGAGTKSFMNLQARVSDGDSIPVETPETAVAAGMDLYLTAWTTLLASRLAVGTIGKEDYQKHMRILKERFSAVKAKICQP
jgi:hypothetical protein